MKKTTLASKTENHCEVRRKILKIINKQLIMRTMGALFLFYADF